MKSKKQVLEYIAQRLLEKETIEAAEFNDIVTAEARLSELPLNKSEETSTGDADTVESET